MKIQKQKESKIQVCYGEKHVIILIGLLLCLVAVLQMCESFQNIVFASRVSTMLNGLFVHLLIPATTLGQPFSQLKILTTK